MLALVPRLRCSVVECYYGISPLYFSSPTFSIQNPNNILKVLSMIDVPCEFWIRFYFPGAKARSCLTYSGSLSSLSFDQTRRCLLLSDSGLPFPFPSGVSGVLYC